VAVLIEFALYWASLILLRAMQLRVKLPCTIVVLFVDSFLPFLRFLCTYSTTVQYSTVLLYKCSKQKHKADHGHKKGHAPRAL
jgi:hypothetical protein